MIISASLAIPRNLHGTFVKKHSVCTNVNCGGYRPHQCQKLIVIHKVKVCINLTDHRKLIIIVGLLLLATIAGSLAISQEYSTPMILDITRLANGPNCKLLISARFLVSLVLSLKLLTVNLILRSLDAGRNLLLAASN